MTAKAAAQSRIALDHRFQEFPSPLQYRPPLRGWIRAVRQALGMTTRQLANRLGIKQPSVTEMEQAEAEGGITLATLRRAAAALDCTLFYTLVPNQPLEKTIRDRAREFILSRRGPIEHSMLLEAQETSGIQVEAAIDQILSETNPRLFWD